LRKSHENEKRLISKCKELNQEIVANAAKIQTALRLSVQDQNSIALLKKELDKAWRMVDNAQDKEKRARETIQRLKVEIQNLSHLVDQGASLSVGQENAVNELLKVKEDLTRDVAAHQAAVEKADGTIAKLTRDKSELQERVAEAEAGRAQAVAENTQLQEQVTRVRTTANQYQQQMVNLQLAHEFTAGELKSAQAALQQSQGGAEQHRKQVHRLEEEAAHLCSVNTELKRANEHLEQLKAKHDEHAVRLAAEKQQLVDAAAVQQQQQTALKEQLKQERAQKARLEAEVGSLQEKQQQQLAYRQWLKAQMKQVLKSFEAQQREAEVDEKLVRELQTQVRKLSGALHVANNKNCDQYQLLEQVARSKEHLETDMAGYKREGQELRKVNYGLEKQCEKLSLTANLWHGKYAELEEQLRLRAAEAAELSKQLVEERARGKLQKNVCEQARSDANKATKQTVQQQDQLLELRHQQRLLAQQAEQLKEEVRSKDAALINEHFAYKRLQADLVIANKKLAKRKEVLGTADRVLAAQDEEVRLLRRQLVEAEVVLHQQERAYDELLQERDILGTQLVRRNDELALLHEKLRIQRSTLAKGEGQYRERLQDLRALKIAINNLKHELESRSQEAVKVEALKHELYYLQRELLQEQTKVKALSEELVNPMHVHRWRRLQGKDPRKHELLCKLRVLQRRLLGKHEELVASQMMLADARKQQAQTQQETGASGAAASEQLVLYQTALRDKTKQLKAMAAELNLYQAQLGQQQQHTGKLVQQNQQVKQQLYAAKKQQMEKPRSAKTTPRAQQLKAFSESHNKIVGGGFNLSLTLPSASAQVNAQ
jgi:chromosome segregation ATPase